MVHALITIFFSAVGYLCGLTELGFLAAAFYAGREHAQAEYRYIEAHGGKRDACPWYCGFLPSAWTLKGMMDWMPPVAVAVAMCVLPGYLEA